MALYYISSQCKNVYIKIYTIINEAILIIFANIYDQCINIKCVLYLILNSKFIYSRTRNTEYKGII